MGMEMFWKFGKQSSIPQKWQFPCKLEGNISQQQADEIDDLVCLEYEATNFVGYTGMPDASQIRDKAPMNNDFRGHCFRILASKQNKWNVG